MLLHSVYDQEMKKAFAVEQKKYKMELTKFLATPEGKEFQAQQSERMKASALRRLKFKLKELTKDKPSKPPSAHNLFIRDFFVKGPSDMSAAEKFQQGSAKWIALSASEKEAYEKQAQALKKQNENDTQAWNASMDLEVKNQIEELKRKIFVLSAETELKDLEAKMPIKPLGAKALFYETVSTADAKTKKEAWDKMTKDERKVYNDKAKGLRDRYLADLEEWKGALRPEQLQRWNFIQSKLSKKQWWDFLPLRLHLHKRGRRQNKSNFELPSWKTWLEAK